MEKAGLALIGCGYWGKNYVSTLRDIDGFPLMAICDSNENVLKSFGIKYPHLRLTTDYKPLLNSENITGAIVATPASRHYEIAKDFLEHGKEVLVEKPLTTDSREAESLCKIAEKNSRVLMTGHVFKYNPSIVLMKEIINSGEIGEVRYIESRRVGLGPIRKDVSALWDLASHDIYIASHLTGKNPKSVRYAGVSHNGKIDDISCLNLIFEDNVLGTIYVNWEHPNKERILVVGGTKKAISFDDIEPSDKIKIYDKGVTYQPATGEFSEFLASTRDGNILLPKVSNAQPLKEEIEHFLKCIKREEKCRTDGLDGLANVRVLEAAEKSRINNGVETLV